MSGTRLLEVPLHSKPIGRYSPAAIGKVADGAELVCVSGQVAVDAGGRVLCPGDARGQAEIVFAQLVGLLEQAGGALADLLSVTIFLSDRAHFPAFNEVRNRVFESHAPASTLVIAELMEPGCLVEVNGLALIGARQR